MSVSTGNSLMRQCINILDSIYTKLDCVQFITTLHLIEVKLFNNSFPDLESFKEELLHIPQITIEFLNSINLSIKDKYPEEYCTTPIYSSIHAHEQSMMYSVNIKSYRQLHFSLYDAMKNPSNLPIHRLFIIKNGHFLLSARDHIHNFLTLFFDVETRESSENPDISFIKANILIVHPLGEFHTSELDEFEGWMKVKIAMSKSITSIIPKNLAERLFDKKEQIARKTSLKTATDSFTAKENELTFQFFSNITGSCIKKIDAFYDMKIENLLEQNNDYTPSNVNMSQLIPSDKLIEPSSQRPNTKLNVNISTTKTNSTLKNADKKSSDTTSAVQLELVESTNTNTTESEKPVFQKHWRRLEKFSYEKNAEVVPMTKYDAYINRNTDAEGYFKHVYFTTDKVIQVFRRSTASQRVVEIASLLALKDKDHIGRIKELLYDESGDEIIGLTMDRYNMTLKQYLKLHSRRRLSAEQRMHIVIQMLKSIYESHQLGIAHRDLSTVNFMIDTSNMDEEPPLYLIDFGKAVFFNPRDAKKWWVDCDGTSLYEDELNPSSKEELAIWCKNLPYVMARPDHGYRFYRSIQTLPRTNKDHELLPYLIDPAAEDIYSLGNIIWKIFLDIEPWPGIFDTDLKKLRETVGKDENIDKVLDQVMPGPFSKRFLQMFLRAEAEKRKTAGEILTWLEQPEVYEKLIAEWSLDDGCSRKATQKARMNKDITPTAPVTSKPIAKTKVKSPINEIPAKRTIKAEKPKKRQHAEVDPEPAPKNEKPASKYIEKDGVKCFAKSGIPIGRPRNSPKSVVEARKPRGRPKKIRAVSADKEEDKQEVNLETSQYSRAVSNDNLTRQNSDETMMSNLNQDDTQNHTAIIPTSQNTHDTKLSTPFPSPKSQPPQLPSTLSRPPSLSPQPAQQAQSNRSRQSSQSTLLSLSPSSNIETAEHVDSNENLLPELSSRKRKFGDIAGDSKTSGQQDENQNTDTDQKLKKGRLAVIDEFDRALYNILQNFGLDKS